MEARAKQAPQFRMSVAPSAATRTVILKKRNTNRIRPATTGANQRVVLSKLIVSASVDRGINPSGTVVTTPLPTISKNHQ